MIALRALAVWLVIIAAETLHGIVRRLLLVPVVGELRANQIGVAVGSLIVLAAAFAFHRWLGAQSWRHRFGIGVGWVLLTIAFELALGALVGLPLERMLADYDIAAGGYMSFGLAAMALAPAFAAWLRAPRAS